MKAPCRCSSCSAVEPEERGQVEKSRVFTGRPLRSPAFSRPVSGLFERRGFSWALVLCSAGECGLSERQLYKRMKKVTGRESGPERTGDCCLSEMRENVKPVGVVNGKCEHWF